MDVTIGGSEGRFLRTIFPENFAKYRITVADPEFSRGGANLLLICIIIAENYMKMTEIGLRQLALPRSATGLVPPFTGNAGSASVMKIAMEQFPY